MRVASLVPSNPTVLTQTDRKMLFYRGRYSARPSARDRQRTMFERQKTRREDERAASGGAVGDTVILSTTETIRLLGEKESRLSLMHFRNDLAFVQQGGCLLEEYNQVQQETSTSNDHVEIHAEAPDNVDHEEASVENALLDGVSSGSDASFSDAIGSDQERGGFYEV